MKKLNINTNKWYFNTWFLCVLFAFWFFFFIPPIIAAILLIIKSIAEKNNQQDTQQARSNNEQLANQNRQLLEQINQLTQANNTLTNQNKNAQQLASNNQKLIEQNNILQKKLNELGINDYADTKQKIQQMETQAQNQINEMEATSKDRLIAMNNEIRSNNELINKLRTEIQELQKKDDKLKRSVASQEKKITRSKELYNSIDYAINNFFTTDAPYKNCKLNYRDLNSAELLAPSIILQLHCMDVKSLRAAYRENEKLIDKVLQEYSTRYTTKANKTIYNLVVIALRSEMQNVLYNLKYEKLDNAMEHIKDICAKYLVIAGEGNQSIAGTLTKFIGELEYLFMNSAKIEYNYYVKREQAKQEQLALKEKMKQEAEERKALEAEKQKIAKEEEKYNNEISKIQDTLSSTTQQAEIAKLQARILELQSQLSQVVVKKDEISNLQNGKAGTVYIISNLGAFGENVFKVGMTRRLDPQDRINELGNASVPFKFDVHSFIFSQDAVALENKMHQMLNDKRVNKVNMRKEFFKVSIDELEQLVNEIEPTAEFNRTMVASEFRQTLSTDSNYTTTYSIDNDDDEELEYNAG